MTGTLHLIAVGLVVHLVFFYSIFDIYFTSPVVHGMSPVNMSYQPPARRLVLFVADGLRADKFFELDEKGQSRAPYLRKIIETKGAWGVSHTRVPTESRPGHVALIAGLYEDVSAVAKGWKENPVEFDSVFNKSQYTWSWGSPDILPMFSKGASGDHVFIDCYSAEEEDFAAADRSSLDTWVFNKIQKFFETARNDTSLMNKIKSDRVVYFLHLLGIDTNGHSNKPYSREYLENIRIVDSGIKNVVESVENLYGNDGRTAYIMTSDHGMTNWGSHGAGHPSETLTPLVAWGAGVRGPKQPINRQDYTDSFSKDWKLEKIRRSDVEQADIAALMAALIGVPYPVNSVGRLPVDYLQLPIADKAEAMFANVQQMLAQYERKMDLRKSTTLSVTFRPFRELTSSKVVDIKRHVAKLIQHGQFDLAIETCQDVIETILKGLNFYQTYDRFFLGTSITFGFLGWITYILTLTLEEYSGVVRPQLKVDRNKQQPKILMIKLIFISLGIFVTILLFVQSLPWTNYLYCLLPVTLWASVALRFNTWQQTFKFLLQSNQKVSMVMGVLALLAALEIMVLGFFWRELLSVGLLGMGLGQFVTSRRILSQRTCIVWCALCILLAVFPLLPVVGRATNYNLVILNSVISFGLALFGVKHLTASGVLTYRDRMVYCIQILLVAVSTFIVYYTSLMVADREGVPALCQTISWAILGFSFLQPLLGPVTITSRLLCIGLAFLAPYTLLSISHEALFVLSLCALLYWWLHLECQLFAAANQKTGKWLQSSSDLSISQRQAESMEFQSFSQLTATQISKPDQRTTISLDDARRALFYIFLLLIAFFGTGNIASINSFDPTAVYCFLTVFSPFVMGMLLMVKVLIPLLLVTCVFRAIHVVTKLPLRAFFFLVLIMTDLMALHFFFLVRDYGSWLDIGTSISHYVIVMCMIIFMMLLLGVSHVLTNVHINMFYQRVKYH